MRFATRPLTKSAFGSPTRPGLGPRFEKSQNLVSTKVPDVIESLRASCNGSGIDMAKVKGYTWFGRNYTHTHVVWEGPAIKVSTPNYSSARGIMLDNPNPQYFSG